MEENKDQSGRFLTPETIKASIGLMLTKQHGNYQQTVEQLRGMHVGEDNVEQVQQVMRNINAFLKTIEDRRKAEKEPYLEQGRVIDKAYKDFAAPIEEVKTLIQPKLNAVAQEKLRKEQEELQKKQKDQQVIDSINNFILNNSMQIAAATTNDQLLSIERLINLEKANKSKYGEQLPLLIERCNELTGKIKEQKGLVKQKEQLEEAKKAAEKAGDDQKLDELKNKEQEIEEKIAENTILVQEQATNSIIHSEEEESNGAGTKARRTVWKAELINAKEAMKKAPEMLDIALNTEKVRESINMLKSTGLFKGKTEYVVNGIRFYEEKTF